MKGKKIVSYMLPEYGNIASILKLEEMLVYAWPVNLQQPDTISLQEQFWGVAGNFQVYYFTLMLQWWQEDY
jgi:hypothetical protein